MRSTVGQSWGRRRREAADVILLRCLGLQIQIEFWTLFAGRAWKRKSNVLLFPFQLCNKMSSLEEEDENAIWMIYYSFYLWVKLRSYDSEMKKPFCQCILIFKFDISNWMLVTICWGIFWDLNLKHPFLFFNFNELYLWVKKCSYILKMKKHFC